MESTKMTKTKLTDTDVEQSETERTPIKQRLRWSKLSQTEIKSRKVKNRRLSTLDMPLNFIHASPAIEKIKRTALLNISPSQCFVNVQRLRPSKLESYKKANSSSSENTDNESGEDDISQTNMKVQPRNYVVHPRFLDNNNYSGNGNNDSDKELKDTLNSTFTLLPDENDSTRADEKGADINKTGATAVKHSPNSSIKRRTFDKIEINVNANNNYDSEDAADISNQNFSNVTLRKRNTFLSVHDSSSDTDYHSPNERRLTFNKADLNVVNASEENCKENISRDSYVSCNDEFGKNSYDKHENKSNITDLDGNTVDMISKQNHGTADVDNLKLPTVNERLTFDLDDIKGIQDSNKININTPRKIMNIHFPEAKSSATIYETSPPTTLKENKQFSLANKVPCLDQEQEKLSITKKLSKFKKPKNEIGKVLNVSKAISRSSRVISARTPKISGSKALQLYDYLTDGTSENNTTIPSTNTQNSVILVNTPPPGTSTPRILKNHAVNSLLKNTLKKESHNVSIANNNDTADIIRKFISRKMPNFAQLHKRQFDNMENISDYKERKSERAKLLLSGTKPLNDSNIRPVNKKIVKPLLMQSMVETKSILEKSNGDVVLPDLLSSIYPDNKENDINVNNLDSKTLTKNRKKVTMNISPETPGKKSQGMLVKKTPFKLNSKSSISIEELDKEQDKINKKLTPPLYDTKPEWPKPVLINSNGRLKTSNLRHLQPKSKNNSNVLKKGFVKNTTQPLAGNDSSRQRTATIQNSNKSKPTVPDTKEKTGYTRFGFTVPVKLNKNDAVKAVTSKTRTVKNNHQEQNRAIIKGVRSNRRFDLLMEMRNKK